MRYDVDHLIKMCVMVLFPMLKVPLSLPRFKELKHENIVGLLDYQVGLGLLFLEPHLSVSRFPVLPDIRVLFSGDANTSVVL